MARLYTYSGFLGSTTPEKFSGNGPCTVCGIDPTAQLFSRMGMSYRDGGTAEQISFTYDPVVHINSPSKLNMFHKGYLRVNVRPGASEPIFMINSANGAAFDLLRLHLTAAGQLDLRLWNGAAYVSVGTSGALVIGQVYRVEVSLQYTSAVSPAHDNLAGAALIDGGNFAIGNFDIGAVTNDGSNICTWGYAGVAVPTAYEIDLAQLSCDDTNWVGATQFTQLALTGQGTYDEWVANANRDFRGMLAFPDPHTGAFTAGGIYGSTLAGQRVSFTVESMAARGITGALTSMVIAVMCPTMVPGTAQLILRRNGAETLQNITVTAGVAACCLFDATGWLPSDVLEIGLKNSAGGLIRLTSITAVVEHTTATDVSAGASAVCVLNGTYFGTGLYQTINLAAIDPDIATQRPDMVLIMPAAASGSPGAWWWDGMRSAHPSWADSLIRSDGIFAAPGKFYIACDDASVNQLGVKYAWVALFDPQRRVSQRGAVQLKAGADNRNVALKSGTFTPEGILIAKGTVASSSVNNMYWRGPGMAGDQSSRLDDATAVVADAIQSMAAGTFQVGTLCANNTIGFEYCGFRTTAFVVTHLIAIGSYVGDGAGARAIPVTLDGGVPACTMVAPTNAVARHVRMGGRCMTFSGAVAATAITNEGANQFNVGITLNAVGVTYSYLVFAPGCDLVPPAHGCVDTFAVVPAVGGHACLVNF